MNPLSFNVPYTSTECLDHIKELVEQPDRVNSGRYYARCKAWFEERWPGYTAFLTTSCTRALELAALGMGLTEGDEVILSPFNYVGVGNAFALHGARLVYADIDPETMNIDPEQVECLITERTRAVVAMHYAGVPCDMDRLRRICDDHGLVCIEDNAQGIGVSLNGRPLGSFGEYSVMSFDTQKNISCHEGGVLLCRNELAPAVDIAFLNGSNRTAFLKGAVKKYEWVAKGSKFTMNEYTAAVLYPLLEQSPRILGERLGRWNRLFDKIAADASLASVIPPVMLRAPHNGHIAYIKLGNAEERDRVMRFLNDRGVPCAFHYVPLDHSEAGQRYGTRAGACPNSDRESDRLLRLPMYNALTEEQLDHIVSTLQLAIGPH